MRHALTDANTALAALAFCCTAVSAQTVHIVGPGGFAQIQPAIAAAAVGDTIVVQGGVYTPFALTKGLTLTAAPGALVQVASQTFPTVTTVVLLPAGQQAHVIGIQFRNLAPIAFAMNILVDNSTAHFSDCMFESPVWSGQPGLVVRNSDVVLHRCWVLGGGGISNNPTGHGGAGSDGLDLDHSTLTATDCLFAGGHLNWDFIGGAGHGIVAFDSQVHLSHCVSMGGNNHWFNPGWPPGNGALVLAGSSMWLADCLLLGGHGNAGTGAHALVNQSAIPVQLARTTLGGGSGAIAGGASTGPVITAPLLGGHSVGPLRIGAAWTVTYTASPGTPVSTLSSDRLAPGLDPRVIQPAWLPATAAFATAGVTDSSGTVTFGFVIPNHPALLHATSWLHGYAGTTLPVQSAPPLGGVAR